MSPVTFHPHPDILPSNYPYKQPLNVFVVEIGLVGKTKQVSPSQSCKPLVVGVRSLVVRLVFCCCLCLLFMLEQINVLIQL